ncbi:Uncharacterised protein [Vibrio cholerae]|nr:Uncharacterised protein [Vibrio cholerae]CSH86657.1 Uncharacterised protein [Vibrio cholerae]
MKWRSNQVTQPIFKLVRALASKPSPIISSVLAPPISTTKRRPKPPEVCATPL